MPGTHLVLLISVSIYWLKKQQYFVVVFLFSPKNTRTVQCINSMDKRNHESKHEPDSRTLEILSRVRWNQGQVGHLVIWGADEVCFTGYTGTESIDGLAFVWKWCQCHIQTLAWHRNVLMLLTTARDTVSPRHGDDSLEQPCPIQALSQTSTQKHLDSNDV